MDVGAVMAAERSKDAGRHAWAPLGTRRVESGVWGGVRSRADVQTVVR